MHVTRGGRINLLFTPLHLNLPFSVGTGGRDSTTLIKPKIQTKESMIIDNKSKTYLRVRKMDCRLFFICVLWNHNHVSQGIMVILRREGCITLTRRHQEELFPLQIQKESWTNILYFSSCLDRYVDKCVCRMTFWTEWLSDVTKIYYCRIVIEWFEARSEGVLLAGESP